jgi:hypothetical protein
MARWPAGLPLAQASLGRFTLGGSERSGSTACAAARRQVGALCEPPVGADALEARGHQYRTKLDERHFLDRDAVVGAAVT